MAVRVAGRSMGGGLCLCEALGACLPAARVSLSATRNPSRLRRHHAQLTSLRMFCRPEEPHM